MSTNELLRDSLVAARAHKRSQADSLAWRILTFSSVVPISFVARRLLEAPERLVISIPDDAFYYLTLAVNFIDLGRWSFDHGVSVTNGFHPLYAFLLLPLAAVFGFSFALLKSAILANAIVFAGTIGWLVEQLRRAGHSSALLAGLACVVGCQILAFNLTTAVEGTLAICIMLLLWSSLLLGIGRRSWVFVLGLLAPLARIELAATALGLWALSLLYTWARRLRALDENPALPVARYATAASGSLLGSVIVMAHNQWAAGTLLQESGLLKLALAERLDALRRLSLFAAMVTDALSPFSLGQGMGTSPLFKLLVLLAGGLAVLALGASLFRAVDAQLRERDCPQVHWPFALLAAAGCVLAYLLLYSRSIAQDVWYLAAFLPPVWLLVSFALRGVLDTPRVAGLASAALGLFICCHLWRAHTTQLRPAQRDIYRSGVALRERLAPSDRVGAFNAGLLGFMLEGRVVNLDGLVNADAAAVLLSGHVDCYIREAGLTYVFDLAQMFAPAGLEAVGLTPAVARGALVPAPILPDAPGFENVALLRVDGRVLQQHCRARD